ncbi:MULTISPECIES: DUF4255 domain-containing protein [Streptomyces]|uniref:DUF4255 domain-containing protein n=1 Tax=Streptomyces TaxID=1883 RepID=UPI000CF23144|nr:MULTISPECIES: DUF4255 domain-containing protein [Streptomyces]PPS67827.1 hypothetical protein BV882_35905 [Streptomyces sp. 46]
MNSALALAAITTTIRFVLQRELDPPQRSGVAAGVMVTTRHPSKLAHSDGNPQRGINVYCYQVTPQATGNVAALPTRRSGDSLMARPTAAVDLHYLISCYGDDESLEPQRLLGTALGSLTATPVLTTAVVAKAVDRYRDDDAIGPLLREVPLEMGREPARLSPLTLSLEEMSNLWGMFGGGNESVLSVAWLASAAVITSDDHVRVAPPVLIRTVDPRPTGGPLLESVEAAGPGPTAVVERATVVLRGRRLLGPDTRVVIGPVEFAPGPGSSDSEVHVGPLTGVPAGVRSVQVLHRSPPGPGEQPSRTLASSNAVPLLVRPKVTAETTATDVVLTLDPPLRKGQRVTVLLTHRSGGGPDTPADLSFDLPRVATETTEQKVPRSDVPEGIWLVRVRVDGVDSLPERIGDSTFGRPVVDVGATP